jgi:hypothetical protein
MRPSDGMTAEEARIALAADVARRKPLETPQRSRACDLPRDSRGRFQRRVNRLDGDVESRPSAIFREVAAMEAHYGAQWVATQPRPTFWQRIRRWMRGDV